MARVFISYRRSDTDISAHSLKTVLQASVPGISVFLDTDDMPLAVRWRAHLLQQIDASAVALVLIGPDWRGPDGHNRFADSDDPVRVEVRTALSAMPDCVLPIVFEKAQWPPLDLPPDLEMLTRIQSTPLTGLRWLDDVQAITTWVADRLSARLADNVLKFPKPSDLKRLFRPLPDEEIDQLLRISTVAGWSRQPVVLPGTSGGTELFKVFKFKNFERAFDFMKRVATKADLMNHHPDWRNVYNQVEVRQRTWDAGHVVTNLDVQMAESMNTAAEEVAR